MRVTKLLVRFGWSQRRGGTPAAGLKARALPERLQRPSNPSGEIPPPDVAGRDRDDDVSAAESLSVGRGFVIVDVPG